MTENSSNDSSIPWLFGIVITTIGAITFLLVRQKQVTNISKEKRAEFYQYIEAHVNRGYSPILLEEVLLKQGWTSQHINDAFTNLSIRIDAVDSAAYAQGKEPFSQQ